MAEASSPDRSPAATHAVRPGSVADLLGLVMFGLVTALAAGIGSLLVTGVRREYHALAMPGWAAPAWLFGPVWAVLYVTIALAGWLTWRRLGRTWRLVPYAAQLVLNAAWTPIFFGAGAYGLAVVDIAALWLAIGATVVAFWPVRRPAALLLLPYWLWVSYAAALNGAIWWLNS